MLIELPLGASKDWRLPGDKSVSSQAPKLQPLNQYLLLDSIPGFLQLP